MVAKKDRLDETEGEESKDLDRSQKAIPGNLSDNSISSRVEPRWRNLFTGLIMVFRRVHLRFSCFSAAVNGLTTNRLDLHRITNAFTTNLSCVTNPRPPHSFLPLSFRRDISVYLSFSSLSSPLLSRDVCARSSPPIPAKISGLGRVVDWKSAIPVRGDRLRQRLSMLICFGVSRIVSPTI